MKFYIRQIKPYIQPPALPGLNCDPYPVDGYDWVFEDLEEELRKNIVVKDSWSTLIFKERFVKVEIETIGPRPTEVIALHFNFDISLDGVRDMFDKVQKKFPNNSVIALPDKASLQICDKEFLENYISMICEIIETL